MSDNQKKAIIMVSGGLDSTLAARLILDQGIPAVGVNFYTGFCIIEQRRRAGGQNPRGKSLRSEPLRAGSDLQMPVEIIDISKEYFEIVLNPKHGYGANVNPCIDCRIYMMRKVREMIDRGEGDYLVTGEVLGQRPMSQLRPTLQMIEKESGLSGLVVRPLSALRLPASLPEEKGWVKRELLFGISGRGRKEQIKLARELGVTDYPQPSGGCCFLTDENFARRFRDFLVHERQQGAPFDMDAVILLRTGRHFRLPGGMRLIVGRDEGENAVLDRYAAGRWRYEVQGTFSRPVVIAEGDPSEEDHLLAASIAARYSDLREESAVNVERIKGDNASMMEVAPDREEKTIGRLRI